MFHSNFRLKSAGIPTFAIPRVPTACSRQFSLRYCLQPLTAPYICMVVTCMAIIIGPIVKFDNMVFRSCASFLDLRCILMALFEPSLQSVSVFPCDHSARLVRFCVFSDVSMVPRALS